MVPKERHRPRRLSPHRLVVSAGAVFALLFAGFFAPSSTAVAAVAGDGGKRGHGKVLEVVLVNEPPVFGDFTLTPGDTVLLEDPAYIDGVEAGDSLTRIQFLEGGSFLLDCTVRLEGKGNLVFAGGEEAASLETGVTFAVTGGTGKFSGTGGQVTITPTELNGARASLLKFHLRH